jgi:hypothetical protein
MMAFGSIDEKDYHLKSLVYVHLLRPLCWLGLLHETRYNQSERFFAKTALWPLALTFEETNLPSVTSIDQRDSPADRAVVQDRTGTCRNLRSIQPATAGRGRTLDHSANVKISFPNRAEVVSAGHLASYAAGWGHLAVNSSCRRCRRSLRYSTGSKGRTTETLILVLHRRKKRTQTISPKLTR